MLIFLRMRKLAKCISEDNTKSAEEKLDSVANHFTELSSPLTSIKFAECSSMDDYIVRTLDNRVFALLRLGKLGPDYQPLYMGLTASGVNNYDEKWEDDSNERGTDGA